MRNNDLTKYAEIGRKIREIPQERPVSSHEWEELVQRLYSSDDTGLHDIGVRELSELLHKRPTRGGKLP
jgi:hypothetical protein